MKNVPKFTPTLESVFWSHIEKYSAYERKNLEFTDLRLSGKTGFYMKGDNKPIGIVERVFTYCIYLIKEPG